MEGFDSWEGFLKAGFELVEKDLLRLTTDEVECEVRKDGSRLNISIIAPQDGPIADFNFPLTVSSFYYWAALFASRERASEREFAGDLSGWDAPQELVDLMQLGLDNQDELPFRERVDAEHGHDPMPDNSATSDIANASLDDLLLAVQKAVTNLSGSQWDAAKECMSLQDVEGLKACSERVAKLKEMAENVSHLQEIWHSLEIGENVVPDCVIEVERTKPDGAANEPIVAPLENRKVPERQPIEKNRPTRARTEKIVTRKRMSNFKVTFPDGSIILGDAMGETYCQVIDRFGAERVASLGLEFAGDPIVASDPSAFRKMRHLFRPAKDGWFVKTHMAPYSMLSNVKTITSRFGQNCQIEEIFAEDRFLRKAKGKNARHVSRAKKTEYVLANVVKKFIPLAIERGLVADDELSFLLSKDSSIRFKTHGYPVLLESTGRETECFVKGDSHARYYTGILIKWKDKGYRLTSQFEKTARPAVHEWLVRKGFAEADLECVGKGNTWCEQGDDDNQPSLFDNLDLFAGSDRGEFDDTAPIFEHDNGEGERFVRPEVVMPVVQEELIKEAPYIIAETIPSEGLLARDVKASLREEMKKHSYTPVRLAAGLRAEGFKVTKRQVRGWFRGTGVLTKEQYVAVCRHMAIAGLRSVRPSNVVGA